jgi:nitrite reductase/ring-hydroxylating ferredoxin subunit
MAATKRLICDAEAVAEGGSGVRFTVSRGSEQVPAFVVRFDGLVRGFENRCAHIPVELDWLEGQFFDSNGLYLICSTHGATYDPQSGFCVRGPCKGRSLARVEVEESDGKVYCID